MSTTNPPPDTPTVSTLADDIHQATAAMAGGWVQGELRKVSQHTQSGHIYFTLGDESATLDACIWRGRAHKYGPPLRHGQLVQVRYERVDFYAARGSTRLIVDRVRPIGDNQLARQRRQTLLKLQADGLCDPDRHTPVPPHPRAVGVIAEPDSLARLDMLRALHTRLPSQDVVVCAAATRGADAIGSLIDALTCLQALPGVDVLILASTDGSPQELVTFDDERLCRAIFACPVPVITSVSPGRDRRNCDYVAAGAAPGPAKAAEMAIALSAHELLGAITDATGTIHAATERALTAGHERLAHARALIDARDPERPGWTRVRQEHGGSVNTTELREGTDVWLHFPGLVARAQITELGPAEPTTQINPPPIAGADPS